ncbi:nucleoside recognition protein [Cuneatibacter caecimuris]|uniref:Spore maturation protein A n=1 Tax=Cuneatibacter caecimuris TaxID=1796618 RepID=A0A4Q7PQ15_9FIRM|nr:nucleoside recognition protein [Cuneatibacter caecimuris]RZT03129.1 spore maturation protein A [Cuneatibacter caecimuris]
MLNMLWAAMIALAVIWGAFTGNMEAVTNGAIEAAEDAVTLCVTMLGVMSLWTGMMEVASEAGLIARLTKLIRPFLHWMFPRIPKGHKAEEYISTNIIANVLGLGWAATPAGLKAMDELAKLEEERRSGKLPGKAKPKGIASNEMCTFLIINISSLQLIPVNMITYRSQYGSVNPAAIVGPAILATLVSTIAGILFIKLAGRER